MKAFLTALFTSTLLLALAPAAQAQTWGEIRAADLAHLRAEILGAYAQANTPGCKDHGLVARMMIDQAVVLRFEANEFSPGQFDERMARGHALIAEANAVSQRCAAPDVAKRGEAAKRHALRTDRTVDRPHKSTGQGRAR
jgi:hypothetical protein